MPKRSLQYILSWALACTSAYGQESGVIADPIGAYKRANPDAADAESTTSFHLRGVLISPSARSALVNGKVSREGDRVGGAEILAIDEGEVRILMGSRELTVQVGSIVVPERSSGTASRTSRDGTERQPVQESNPPVGPVPFVTPIQARLDSRARHGPVKRGETLSGIAEQYLRGRTTRNQMMMALFQANPQAFDGNINVLRAGAILRIPDTNELQRQAPGTAAIEVVRHTEAWRAGNQPPTRLAEVPRSERYGPVSNGETLSVIAERLLRGGTTLNQTMIALYQANPQAFDGNINVLRKGAVLRIPDEDELRRQDPEAATAEVVRHTDAWRTGYLRQDRSATVHALVTASSQESAHPTIPPFR